MSISVNGELDWVNSEREPLVVEFFGPPGAGKSTLAREVVARLGETNVTLVNSSDFLADERRKMGRALRKVRLILSSRIGKDDLRLISQAMAVRQTSLKDRIRAVSTLSTALAFYSQLAKTRRCAVVDQGLLQAAFSVTYRSAEGDSDGFVDALTRRAAESRRIHVSVRAPRETCIARLKDRTSKHSRLQSNDTTDWMRAERVLQSIWDRLMRSYEEAGSEPGAITVDGTLPLDQSAQALCVKLGEFRSARDR